MPHVVTQNCCNDAACVAACPVNCIHPTPDEPDYFSTEMLYIDPEVCIDCGACAEACPVNAIVSDFELVPADAPFVALNHQWFADPAHRDYVPTASSRPSQTTTQPRGGPLRVAVVGTGPAACYTVDDLIGRPGVEVSMFERLPTPWGLARFGVAPDHPETKAVTELFEQTIREPNVRLHLDVEIGKDITHRDLLLHNHAVVYATGAPGDRRLGIPGEELSGSHSATDFVGWYNGHPSHAMHEIDLSCERAVVVGNGNAALDIARILASDPERLASTDIADHALQQLRKSRIREVTVLGRRGPAEASFTTPELLGLAKLADFDVVLRPEELILDPATATAFDRAPHAMGKYKVDVLQDIANRAHRGRRSLALRFSVSPVAVLGDSHVTGVRLAHNVLEQVDDEIVAHATDCTETLDCGLVVCSAGFRGSPLPDIPFDQSRGVVPNRAGRVTDPESGHAIPGVYVTGWIKRGPAGSIGTNKWCAKDTVAAMMADYEAGRLSEPCADRSSFDCTMKSHDALDIRGWEAIDSYERGRGNEASRPRIKLVDRSQMREIANRKHV